MAQRWVERVTQVIGSLYGKVLRRNAHGKLTAVEIVSWAPAVGEMPDRRAVGTAALL
ncbi:MAG TPA: hypothetical protein VHS34_00185 [Terriglobales bacterium]|nr:hypothetical protein [Terriglobales bacterium]